MRVIERKVTEIVPYENNPRVNDDAVDKVAESIREFGFQQPIVVDKDGVIIAGHTRLKAAKKIGLETVPVIQADDLTDEQAKAYRLADNKTNEFATWDFDALDFELLNIEDIDMSRFGFELPEEPDDAEVIEDDFSEDVEPRAKAGDIWKLGDHRLICGDSTDQATIDALMDGSSADLLVTDPPYNVNYSAKSEVPTKAGYYSNPDTIATATKPIANDNMDSESFVNFLIDAFGCASAALKPGGVFYIFHSDTHGFEFRKAVKATKDMDLRQNLVWVKNSFVLGHADYQWKHEPCLYGWKDGAHYFTDDRKNTTVIEDGVPNFSKMKKAEMQELLEQIYSDKVSTTILNEKKPTVNDLHPTMKPVKLIARLVRNSSKPGWNVLDTFGGSGSTLMACEQTNRRCYMCELDPHYCDVIIERWESFTGQKAELING